MNITYKYNPNLKFIKEGIKGNLFYDNQFVFDKEIERVPYERFWKWMLGKNPQGREKKADKWCPQVIKNNSFVEDKQDKIVWLGHSSFYMQLNGIRILTDPIFYHVLPVRIRRRHKLPCSVATLKNINLILLSHGHRDHLDVPSLKQILKYNPDVEILCPLGFKKMLQKIGFKKIQEAAWWQQYNFTHLQIDFLPAKHWNRRHLLDFNKTLWGSFAIQYPNKKIYFAGDTAYAPHFKEIQQHYNDFDIALMPIGAYKPKFIMDWAHISPKEAMLASNEMNVKNFIPMHYGTFDLSDEPASEPIEKILKYKKEERLDANLHCLDVGKVYLV